MEARHFEGIDFAGLTTESHQLRDGRQLAYVRYGTRGGTPVYYFHGCPGSRYEAAPSDGPAGASGFEVFAFDRPGCGRSSYAKQYRMLDWASDVVDFADAMSHRQFGIIGLSGGGAYINSCAYAIPERLLFAYDLAGWAPVAQNEELQTHLAPLDRFFLQRASSFRLLFYLPFSLLGFAAARFSDDGFAKMLQSSMGEDDCQLILGNEQMAHFFRAIVKESFAQGIRGPADDAIRCYSGWGFRLSNIDYPVHLWHGTDDKFADFELAQFKHRVMPHSSLTVFEGRGHLHFVTEYEKLFAEIRKSLPDRV
ncbi:MAG: alpha/beta hydrolase [Cyanobacteria bacterium J06638_20]